MASKNALTRQDLWSLEDYATKRAQFRQHVLNHKKNRKITLGPYAVLHFEDSLTIKYQIQEMLRVERIFEAEGIAAELVTYNPLIPDGHNLKATFFLTYPDQNQRLQALAQLVGIEDTIWLQVASYPKIFAIANEDLARSTPEKTSAVHFLRFEFTLEMIHHLKQNKQLAAGINHPNYTHTVPQVADTTIDALLTDFE